MREAEGYEVGGVMRLAGSRGWRVREADRRFVKLTPTCHCGLDPQSTKPSLRQNR